jgi:2-hydroxy-3-oxopropionate reductase
MNLGFIGLGIMGAPMALHLIEAGHQLYVTSGRRFPESISATNALRCADAAEVVRQAEVVFLMVPDTADVESVLFGAGGVAEALKNGSGARKVIVDMSSISPMATKAFAGKINELGADYVDAPVSGGEVGAKAGTLTIMCGAEHRCCRRGAAVRQQGRCRSGQGSPGVDWRVRFEPHPRGAR